MIHVDTNVLIDVLDPRSPFRAASGLALATAVAREGAGIGQVVFAELAAGIADRAYLDTIVRVLGVSRLTMPDDALFLAGRAYAAYLRRGGPRTSILPDFFIGAHAVVAGADLLTRDPKRYRTAFPQLTIIEP